MADLSVESSTKNIPRGTVTLLMTDIEDSTAQWEKAPESMRAAVLQHDSLAQSIITEHAGLLLKHRGEGDSLFAVFARANDAVRAAAALQRAYHLESWPSDVIVRVRMALHTGDPDLRDGDYYGPVVNRCARLRNIAHGGQALLSNSTSQLVRNDLPPDIILTDLGEHRLKSLQHPERVFQLTLANRRDEFPTLRSLSSRSNNLPVQLTHFIGREQEQADLRALLASTRLLTLTGVGGSGKTRLAVEIAGDLAGNYSDGVWFVDLERLSDPASVVPAIAAALGAKEAPDATLDKTLVAHLQSKTQLLLLDNCEHLLEACATISQTLLRACSGLTILATSRKDLQVAGETVWSISPLSFPDPRLALPVETLKESEAIRLFLDRARNASPRFAFSNKNAAAVARICSRVDGLPLAIELAAARVKILQAQDIDSSLFDLLDSTALTSPERHLSLQALMDWSYSLLLPVERTLFRRLSVFVGGWTLEAAQSVCADSGVEPRSIMKLLLQLARASLVVSYVDEKVENTRYRLLETVRVFAEARLTEAGEEAELHDRHGVYFLGLAEEAAGYLDGPEQAAYLNRLEADHDNLRSVLRWVVNPEMRIRLAAALWRFWFARSHLSEGRGWLENALARSRDEVPRTRAQALRGLGVLATKQSDYARAQNSLEEARALYTTLRDPRGLAETASNLGAVAREQGDWERALRLYEEGLNLSEQNADRRGTATALNNMGMILRDQRQLENAESHFARSLEIYRELGDTLRIGSLLNNLGAIAYEQQRLPEVRLRYQESLDCFRSLGNLHMAAILLYNLGELERKLNGPEGAVPLYRESLEIRRQLGDRGGSALVIGSMATTAFTRGEDLIAVRLYGAAETIHRETGRPYPSSERVEYEMKLAALRSRMGETQFGTEWDAGAAFTFDQTVDYALVQIAS
jgi:predicted ATPase/class 3 adenylate cyclase/Tfp pilus assembly protein PilF